MGINHGSFLFARHVLSLGDASSLEKVTKRDKLNQAFRRVRANRGAASVHGMRATGGTSLGSPRACRGIHNFTHVSRSTPRPGSMVSPGENGLRRAGFAAQRIKTLSKTRLRHAWAKCVAHRVSAWRNAFSGRGEPLFADKGPSRARSYSHARPAFLRA